MSMIFAKTDKVNYFTIIVILVRKIPQPMKIAQLLGSSGKLQNGQSNTDFLYI